MVFLCANELWHLLVGPRNLLRAMYQISPEL